MITDDVLLGNSALISVMNRTREIPIEAAFLMCFGYSWDTTSASTQLYQLGLRFWEPLKLFAIFSNSEAGGYF